MNLTGAPFWGTSTITPHTPPNDVFSTAPDNILDNRLDAPPHSIGIFDNSLTFRHSYNLQEGFDGAVLEISVPSINGGAFTDVTDPAVDGRFAPGTGYSTIISATSQSPIAGRMAWSGNSNGYVTCALSFGPAFDPGFSGNVVLRFRLVTDNSVASTGWRVDTFQWEHTECNPPTATPMPSPTATPTPTATPSVTATPTATSTPAPTATPTPSPTPAPTPSPAQALNISTRLRIETEDRIAIGGFIITGPGPKKVAIRGIGPSLANFGLSDVLADPTIELRNETGSLIAQNDNWHDNSAQAAQLKALGLGPPHPNESALIATLEPGAYTALLAGKNQTSGIALVEIYDGDTASASQLANISTRGFVRTADNVMIAGFILGQGSANSNVVVRGIGPSLSHFGLSNAMADPTLELRDSNGALLIANDNWQDDPISAAQLTARGFAPSQAEESGIFTSLPPGAFTAILAGKNGGVGLGVVEVYSGLPIPPITVTNTADSGAGSLRQAIADAHDGDRIQFAPALFGQTITLTSGELVIDKSITILGPGPDQLTVRRDTATGIPKFRIFHILPGHTITIYYLTISSGFAQLGGGIYTDHSTLTLDGCRVEFNSAEMGGGIYNTGNSDAPLTLINSFVTGNVIAGFFGAYAVQGGGIYSYGKIEIVNSFVNGNSAHAIQNFPYPMGSATGLGIYNSGGRLTINSSFVSGNYSQDIQFSGGAGGILNLGVTEIADSVISNNFASGGGGGISNNGMLTITDSIVSHNSTHGGTGGIGNGENGTMTITNCTVSGNTSTYKQFAGPGGISNSGALTISNSTLSGNHSDGNGGGIHNSGAIKITNSTLVDNFSYQSPYLEKGAVYNSTGGTLTIGNTILKSGSADPNLNNTGTVISQGYNLCSDTGGGFLNSSGDQINADPMVGPLQDNGGPTFTHQLLPGSPAIDKGDPNFTPPPFSDQRGIGYERVVNERIDIGALEVQPTPTPSSTP
jgi:cell division septation protein DedD